MEGKRQSTYNVITQSETQYIWKFPKIYVSLETILRNIKNT
jgi:hypothetical protein